MFRSLLFIEAGLASSAVVLMKRLVFAKAGQANMRARLGPKLNVIADNLLLCIAFSKDGSTVYLMFQRKKKNQKICLSIALFLAPSLRRKKKKEKKKDKLLMMGSGFV